jgi:alpha-amylase/alpha-mannosidase (GH57 family)
VSRVNLVLLWHMHQPQYKDPSTGDYFLPWTRLHALKDYWGMVKILEEFPNVHATFNVVPSAAAQIEEYASGQFKELWFEAAFAPTASLTFDQRREILSRAFQINYENLLRRWPRFAELYDFVQISGAEAAASRFGLQDWCDLQVLSQIAWMDEQYLAKDPVINALSAKGKGYTEADKAQLKQKQMELLKCVLPEYSRVAKRGQIEISTTPFYHPILPLVCDTEIARTANPFTPLPQPAFRHPEDAREQLLRARSFHERVFGQQPVGLWPSEGSVSDQALALASELGFRWFATDEGVLGRTRNIGFWRDASGYPQDAETLYSPWKFRYKSGDIVGFFRDHYLSDLVGFVYSRMDARSAAADLHERIRSIGERLSTSRPATVSVILDGENAWEYYPGNGREFLRRFYDAIGNDPNIRALTVSEAISAAGEIPAINSIFPGSWINANFDVWIGHAEDVQAWELLGEARDAYSRAKQAHDRKEYGAPTESQLQKAYESVLAAEGSDWNWWYGPEHGTPNDAEFDSLYRKHLTEIYACIGQEVPAKVTQPIKRRPELGRKELPSEYIDIQVDGRETNYFEWMGAGTYSVDQRGGAIHGRTDIFSTFYFGFSRDRLFLRADPSGATLCDFPECELRFTVWDNRELRLTLMLRKGSLAGSVVEQGGMCLLHPDAYISAAVGRIAEVGISREMFDLKGRKSLLVRLALWQAGLPLSILPPEGFLDIPLGEEYCSWPLV